jgi:hypothetical protein
MVTFSKSVGAKFLHLGGGYRNLDSLFQFKASFTNDHYYLGKNVINVNVYNELTEIALNSEWSHFDKNFFPLYGGMIYYDFEKEN